MTNENTKIAETANEHEADNGRVFYKAFEGRGRPSKGKVVRKKVVCMEIENLNSRKRVFVPLNKVLPAEAAMA